MRRVKKVTLTHILSKLNQQTEYEGRIPFQIVVRHLETGRNTFTHYLFGFFWCFHQFVRVFLPQD